jgi:hypothetical protein
VRISKPSAFDQLAAEKHWLRGEIQASFLAPRYKPSPAWIDIAKRVETFLSHHELKTVLRVLETHNCDRPKPFLLGPQLFGVILSIEARKTTVQMKPVLDRRPAEVRDHFQEASAKAKALAKLVRKGPQPFIALAAHDDLREVFTHFHLCKMIQSPNELEDVVPLDRLLNEAAAAFYAAARKVGGTRSHQNPTLALRRLATSRLATAFRRQLNKPYHSHVATIVTVLTGLATDADYVKKLDKRDRRSAASSKGRNS